MQTSSENVLLLANNLKNVICGNKFTIKQRNSENALWMPLVNYR